MSGKTPIKDQDVRFRRAAENLKRIEKKISPFVKLASFKTYSTSGKWHETSAWLRAQDEDEKGHST